MKFATVSVVLVLVISMMAGVDISFDVVPRVSGATIYVGGGGAGNYSTIQAGVDAASVNDTVYVYQGTYEETITIVKTIFLTGESYPIINGTITITAPNCQVKGFKIIYGGIEINENNILIEDNKIWYSEWDGINLNGQNSINIIGNEFVSSSQSAIHIESSSSNFLISNNLFIHEWTEILGLEDSIISDNIYWNSSCSLMGLCNNITIKNNVINSTGSGIYVGGSENVTIQNCSISDSSDGIFIDGSDVSCKIIDTIIFNNHNGLQMAARDWYPEDGVVHNMSILNTTILNSELYDMRLSTYYNLLNYNLINTTFDKSKVKLYWELDQITAFWYMHVYVTNAYGDPIPNATVNVKDNGNGTFNGTWQTGPDGYVRWITAKEFVQNDTTKIFYTPHTVTASKGNDSRYRNTIMDQSKTIHIILGEIPSLNFDPGWNPISLPVIPQDTELTEVLSSIEGKYDYVSWYNSSDKNDPWKYHHVQKPSYLNDLDQLDPTMGFYVHVTEPVNITFTPQGILPSSQQNISLNAGWNLVGYPSLTNHNRSVGLNNLTFGTEVDAIQWFDSSVKTWHFLEEGDSFEIGRGYWIHAKTDCVWEVPL